MRKENGGGPGARTRRRRKPVGTTPRSPVGAALTLPEAAAGPRPAVEPDADSPAPLAWSYPSPFVADEDDPDLAGPAPAGAVAAGADHGPIGSSPAAPAAPEVLDESTLAAITEAGLFDPDWYAGEYRDVAGSGLGPALHYLRRGAAEGRRPNRHFDPEWYRRAYPDAAGRELVHYFRTGEALGCNPSPGFDPDWYRERYLGALREVSPLGHYLQSRGGGRFDPNAWFDTEFYLRMNPDVAASGQDPFEHFLAVGFSEGRDPSARFDLRFYQRRHLAGAPAGTNPLIHFLETGRAAGLATEPAHDPFPASEVRRFSAPAPEFEERDPGIGGGMPLAKLVAFYLPQFHPIPENDAWWGKGFTEWTNTSRGTPRFPGHYQPRVPRDFGFYDLRDHGVMRRQVEAARAAGLHGFCFYYYNFNGHRLLEGPVERFLADRDLDWPFTIMWANENWTRRWDGSEAEILIRQDYLPEQAAALVDDIARHFRDPRYIRIDGRPLFFIYRAGIIPEAERTISEWRRLFAERHGEEPWIYIAQTFAEHDPRPFGCDGAVEFPPHKVTQTISPMNDELAFFDHSFSGYVYRYGEVASSALALPKPEFPLFRTVFPGWDNDARRQGRSVIMTESSPQSYQAWLEGAISWARRHPVGGESFVFINAWNEWAEGAYLEPDVHFGGAWLNATARAAYGRAAHYERRIVVLVAAQPSHERPQTLVRMIGRQLRRRHGVEIVVLAIGRGSLRAGPADYGRVVLAPDRAAVAAEAARLAEGGANAAILFGAAAGEALAPLRATGLRTVAVIDEMPGSVLSANEGEWAEAIARDADVVVAPYPSVLAAFEAAFGAVSGRLSVRAHAPAFPPEVKRSACIAFRRELGLSAGTEVVAGAGPATMRNGIDLFAAIARQVTSRRKGVAFVWIGGVPDAETRRWLTAGFAEGELLFRPVPDHGVRDAVAAADILIATAREDAEPVTAVEALAAGLPVLGFAGSGGITDILAGGPPGRLAPFADAAAMANAVSAILDAGFTPAASVKASRERGRLGRAFTEATASLLADAEPDLPRISTVVLSGAAGPGQLSARLGTAFDQTHPVFETLFVDDRATPEQRSLVLSLSEAARREVAVVTLGTVVSRQGERWLDALTRAEGELVWLVPPTGTADRTLLATLAAGFDSERVDAALCRSRCGEAVLPAVPHRGTRAMLDDGEGLAGRLRREPELGADLAAVLWRRSALRAALERLRDAGVAADARSALAAIAEAGGRIAVFAAELSRRDSPPAPAAAPPPRRSPAAAEFTPPPVKKRPAGKAAGKPAGSGAKNAAVRSAASACRPAPKKAAATKGPARRARRRPAAPEA